MAKLLDQPRYLCATAGMNTVQAITRALPVLHAGPGCAAKLGGGSGGSGYISSQVFPCTNLSEKEVVFGGTDRLEETINNALKVIDSDLVVVLSSCISEIIGDDVEEVVRAFGNAGKPVLYASTPGFKSNNYIGHEWVIQAIIEQYLKPASKKSKGLVNIWAGVPRQDIFWYGDLRELENLLTEIGLTPNTIFGYGRGIGNIDKIPQAQFNLVVSPWVGISNARQLEEKFGTPYLHYPNLPIGAYETSKFLRTVGKFAGVDEVNLEKIIARHEEEFYYFIERFADTFFELRVMSKRFVTVSDAYYALAVTKFLVNDFGMFPEKQFITDDTPPEFREAVTGYFKELNHGIQAEAVYSTDGYKIDEEIEKIDFHGVPLILGASWESEIAKKTDAHYLNISWPMVERLVLNSSYAGYAGGLKLLEDIYSVVLKRFF
jgi:Nitrogenase molybdenum-iron protein, alpha and beta chains